jgi:hypothetical protein
MHQPIKERVAKIREEIAQIREANHKHFAGWPEAATGGTVARTSSGTHAGDSQGIGVPNGLEQDLKIQRRDRRLMIAFTGEMSIFLKVAARRNKKRRIPQRFFDFDRWIAIQCPSRQPFWPELLG